MRFKTAIATFAFVALGSAFAPFGILGALFGVTPAYATGGTTVHVLGTPDDSVDGTPWARDTFDRKTTVQVVEEGFHVTFEDTGTFKTPAGIEGTLTGKGEFLVAGGTLKESPDAPASIDRTSTAVKDDFTTSWWKRFIDGGQTEGIVNWKWTYKTDCEIRTESSGEGVEGDYPSKKCATPPGHPSASADSPSVTPSHSKTTSTKPSQSTSAVGAGNGSARGGLPVTGPSVPVIVGTGAGVLLLGAALLLLARKRAARFSA